MPARCILIQCTEGSPPIPGLPDHTPSRAWIRQRARQKRQYLWCPPPPSHPAMTAIPNYFRAPGEKTGDKYYWFPRWQHLGAEWVKWVERWSHISKVLADNPCKREEAGGGRRRQQRGPVLFTSFYDKILTWWCWHCWVMTQWCHWHRELC
jgi:hypothetical protein